MSYFNYHATAKKLIAQGKLKDFYFVDKHNKISPALVLIFDCDKHHVMPIRENRWQEYLKLLPNKPKLK
ncbi:MAG: thermostable hemolysin delta-VPH [Clostridia bacterium]|nr:thermostable hemolysin delta-VPH [Clostridia bacterium]